jgi:hypothetical protein
VAGGDRRWLTLVADNATAGRERWKDPGPVQLVEPPTLMLRLRAGIGVGAKADILAFLLGVRGAAEMRVLSTATGYTARAVRSAATDMALARFIHAIEGPPTTYLADRPAWARLLEVNRLDRPAPSADLPPWHFWSVAFEFLTALIEWSETAERNGWTAYVASSHARDLLKTSQRRLRYLHLPVPAPSTSGGAEFLPLLERFTNDVARWCHEALRGEHAIA